MTSRAFPISNEIFDAALHCPYKSHLLLHDAAGQATEYVAFFSLARR